jgi:hypothetical protein
MMCPNCGREVREKESIMSKEYYPYGDRDVAYEYTECVRFECDCGWEGDEPTIPYSEQYETDMFPDEVIGILDLLALGTKDAYASAMKKLGRLCDARTS